MPNSQADPDAKVLPRDGGPDCNYCGNKRFVLGGDGEVKPCPKCDVAQQWKVDSLKPFSSRSQVSARQTFFNFKTRFGGDDDEFLLDCLHTAEDFANAPQGKWLVMWGERGAGKSHLCAAVDNHLQQSGTPSLFITMPDLLASLKQAMELQTNTEQETYSGRMKTFKTAPVLILDDLGAETSGAWSDGVLFEILDYRYRNRLPTMIATNINPDNFEPRVASRLQDTSLSIVIENAAPDFRRRLPSEK
jgi:DNA replication protein DnaC